MTKYNHKKIEKKWQKYWEENQTFVTPENPKNKKYILDMFPYPSGEGLHVGHPEGYTATDIVSRYSRMKGFDVLHPMGWDGFGLPAENYAIKQGVHPKETTTKNIKRFTEQIKSLGLSYDWNREVNTSIPDYYKWTQWLFLQFYKNGLAYKKSASVNWCPKDNTVLANEQVVAGKCERCGSVVIQKDLAQWFFKITDYAERLLAELDTLDWPEPIKAMQRNWIGKSEGALIKFQVPSSKFQVEVFTTRPDTLFGATYLVLAPEHELIANLELRITNYDQVQKYIEETKKKSELQRTSLEKDKTGVQLQGVMAVNPATGKEIPIWIADYVLNNYGTGAIMAVPAHDQRDFEFAKKYNLPIVQVVVSETGIKRENEERRDGGCGVIFNPKTQKYAIAKHEDGLYRLYAGGVEEGEDIKDGVLREIQEESGLLDYKEVEVVAKTFSHFHNRRKNVNRVAMATCLLVILKSDEITEVKQEAHEQFELAWVTPQEILENWQTRNSEKDLDHWIEFLHQAVGRSIELGYDTTSDASVFKTRALSALGLLMDSGKFSDMQSSKAFSKMAEEYGQLKTQYKLRDWLISRQRYWGAPIPIIYCDDCGMLPVDEKDLPVELPTDVDFKPTGESPLALSKSFHNVSCPKCGKRARRDSDTMDTFVDSSWYFFRYTDSKNDKEFASKGVMEKWLPVDLYVGGAEHAVMHLLYARFFTKVLFDLKFITFKEPFLKLKNQGLILGPDGEKMSKSKGNVVNPDDIVEEFGADSLRLYEMFMGPLEDAKPWSTQGLVGMRRFLERVWSFVHEASNNKNGQSIKTSENAERLLNKLIKKVTEDIENFKFNTAISSFMEFYNAVKDETVSVENLKTVLKLLYPFAPHISEELYESLGATLSLQHEAWPTFDSSKVVESSVNVAVQVNGKVRAMLSVALGLSEASLKEQALSLDKIKALVADKEIKKVIVVQDKVINLVV